MMRNLAERHRGLLPFDTVGKHLARSSSPRSPSCRRPTRFTPTSPAATRRCATPRGSTSASRCPMSRTDSAAVVIDAVAKFGGRPRHVPRRAGRSAGRWWTHAGRRGPAQDHRAPALRRASGPSGGYAGLCDLQAIEDAAVREIVLYALGIERWRDGLQGALAKVGASVESSAGDEGGLNLLIAAPGDVSLDALYGRDGGPWRRRLRHQRDRQPRGAFPPRSRPLRKPTEPARTRHMSATATPVPPCPAPRRAGDRTLCAGQERGARRRQGLQAVLQRDAARPVAEGGRGLRRARRQLELYPDGSSTALREAIGARYGLDPARIVCGTGSDELLSPARHMPMSGRATRASTAEHGFLVYKIAHPRRRRHAGRRDGDATSPPMSTRSSPRDAAHQDRLPRQPQQPDRHLSAFDEVKRLHAGLPPHVLLVLDAAYAEYVRRNDYASGHRARRDRATMS